MSVRSSFSFRPSIGLPHGRMWRALARRCTGSRTALLLFLGVAALAAGAFLLIGWRDLIGDEWVHLQQANDLQAYFREGKPFIPAHPALPGYHVLLALIGMAAGGSTLPFYRAVSLFFNVLGVLVAFRIARALGDSPRIGVLKALQYFFLPIAFPYVFLLYTDVFSVVIVLLGLDAVLRRRYHQAGVWGIVSIAVRQNNVLWAGLLLALTVLQEWRGWAPAAFWHYAKRTWLQMFSFVLLGAFIAWNGGVALADEGAHPAASFHTGNVLFSLLEFPLLLLPLCVAAYPGLRRRTAARPRRTGLLFLGVFLFFMLTFYNTHGYNFDPWWLRNKVLLFFTSSASMKALACAIAAAATLFLARVRLHRRMEYLFYPVSFLYLGASWLVEPRYHFLPFALLLLLRKPGRGAGEWWLLAWFIVLSGILFDGAWHGRYLP